MKRVLIGMLSLLMLGMPAIAKTHMHKHHAKTGSQGAAGLGGNGTTTSSSSDPTMKTGAKRSPTGGAPAH